MYKKRLVIIFLFILPLVGLQAQKRTVDEVKRMIGDQTASIKTFKSAVARIKPALTHDRSKDKAETWWIAGRAQWGLYSKYRISKSIGDKIDEKEMGHALIAGFDYCVKALQLDSVRQYRRDGTPKIDPKNGEIKVKTKCSSEIHNKMLDFLVDFRTVGAELYRQYDWEGAFKSWNIYHRVATSKFAKRQRRAEPDSIIGLMSFYQGLAAVKLNNFTAAHSLFQQARNYGYVKKTVYDNDLLVLLKLNDTIKMVQVAREAFHIFGQSDVKYLRIMINDVINKKNYREAAVMLDQAMLKDSTNAEYFNLKGNIVELQSNVLEARPYYVRAVELNPNLAQAQFDLGRCYYMEALKYLKDNSRESGKALALAVAPVLQRAVPHLEKAFELNPGNVDAKNILRDIYYKLGDGAKLDQLDRK